MYSSGDTSPPPGARHGPPIAYVSRERAGRRGKVVTVLSGVELPNEQLHELSAALKRVCGAGGTVRAGRIEIQGEHRNIVARELSRRG